MGWPEALVTTVTVVCVTLLLAALIARAGK